MISRILPFATVLCALGIFFGYVNPLYTGPVKELSSEIASYQNALAAADQFKAREAALIEERNAIPPEGLKRLETFLPDGVDNVQLILDLNALASRSGIKLTSFDVQAPPTANTPEVATSDFQLSSGQSPTDSISITLSAAGTYNALRTFMAAAEASLRPLDLVSFTVNNSETGVYSYQLVYRIYWLR